MYVRNQTNVPSIVATKTHEHHSQLGHLAFGAELHLGFHWFDNGPFHDGGLIAEKE